MKSDTGFDSSCTKCPRLVAFLHDLRQRYPDYYSKPVPSFGVEGAAMLIVGLAPGMHGANRTGRPFTGDYAGVLLYQTLFELGIASRAEALDVNDGLSLMGCRITNAVRCLPPQNKPLGAEVRTCNPYLLDEINTVPKNGVIFTLGTLAHGAVFRAMGEKISAHKFAHGAVHTIPDQPTVVNSYHCSRYNTQTRRLTPAMFKQVLHTAWALCRNQAVAYGA